MIWSKFEIVYYDVTVEHVSHYKTETPTFKRNVWHIFSRGRKMHILQAMFFIDRFFDNVHICDIRFWKSHFTDIIFHFWTWNIHLETYEISVCTESFILFINTSLIYIKFLFIRMAFSFSKWNHTHTHTHTYIYIYMVGGFCECVMVIVPENGYGDTCSNPIQVWLRFILYGYPWEKYESY